MMATTVEAAMEAVTSRLSPALESLEENVRGARRAVSHGRHAAEDFAAGTALQVRRRPLTSIVLAGAAGTLAGCMLGFALGWEAHYRTFKG